MAKVSDRRLILPNNVSLKQIENDLFIDGPQGSLNCFVPKEVSVSLVKKDDFNEVLTSYSGSSSSRIKRKSYPLVGTFNSIIFSMIKGVISPYERELEVKGVGYKVIFNLPSNSLEFSLGHSHIKKIKIPENISVICKGFTSITVKSSDKQKLGWFCSVIKSLRSRTPYKMKGIYDKGEVVNLKSSKSVNK